MSIRTPGVVVALAALVAVVITAPTVSAAAPSFRGVGSVRPGDVTDALGVSADGSVVVGYSSTGTDALAFRWTAAGGIESLGRLQTHPGITAARAVSADGSIIVGEAGPAPIAFRWAAGTGMSAIGTLSGNSADLSIASALSADGNHVVGTSVNASQQIEAFRWSASTGMVGLGMLSGAPFPRSSAAAITPDASVIVGASESATGSRAVRWKAAGIEPLDQIAGAVNSGASAVSDEGSVIVGSVIPAGRQDSSPFRWTSAGGMKLLRLAPEGEKEYASDVSGDGSIVVGRAEFGAFIWDEQHGMRNLQTMLETEHGLAEQMRGWWLGIAYGISPDGTAIVGTGTNPQGIQEGFIAIIPEPSAIAAAAMAGLLLVRPARRRSLRTTVLGQ